MGPRALSLVLLALAACEGRPRAEPQTSAHEQTRAGPAIAVLDLSEGVPEQTPSGPFGLPGKGGASLHELVAEVERLGRDKRPRGVLVRLGAARVGLGRASEIGAMLEELGRRLPVWCHADDLGNATLYVAARGCRRVWVSPAGSVDAIGLAAQTMYFHKLLSDTLGLDVDFLQVGKYKGAEEPFTRDGPSPEARASLQSTLSELRDAWLSGIRRARAGAGGAAPEDGPYSAPAAKDRGLVDDVGYFDEARDALEKETGAARVEVRVGPGGEASGGPDLGDIWRALAGGSVGGAPVVVVPLTGAISMDGGGLLGEATGIAERRVHATLVRLEKDDDVKAVVVRIDSPGGSALASDLLWHQLMRIRANKPLVVSVGDMAASGGYYLASAGSAIFADETSIVGSIGVVGGKVAAARALERVGVHADTVAAKAGDAHAAARAAYESLLVPWDDATRGRLLETMTGIYELFVARVAEGRRIPGDRVAASAEGRIFGGRDAKARGLVDELGGLREAIARARALAGLPADAAFAIARGSTGLFQAVVDGDAQGDARGRPLSAVAERVAPDLWPFVASVEPIARREPVLCALPYALTIR